MPNNLQPVLINVPGAVSDSICGLNICDNSIRIVPCADNGNWKKDGEKSTKNLSIIRRSCLSSCNCCEALH